MSVQNTDVEREALIYLDQNVLGYVADGSIRLSPKAEVIWVYSDVHFDEMMRGDPIKFIEVLEELEARQIKQASGDGFLIEPYSSVRDRYESHIQAVNEVPFDEAPHYAFIARIFGADNFPEVQKLPNVLLNQIDEILSSYGSAYVSLKMEATEVASNLEEQIHSNLKNFPSLVEARDTLGDSHNKIGDIKADNPIPEIWEVIKGQIPELTIDQFFGREPFPEIEQFERSVFYGIIRCHMMLNFLGYKKDEGTHKAARWANILSDGRHTAYGAPCDVVLSDDSRFCAKANAIYKFFGANAKVGRLTIQ